MVEFNEKAKEHDRIWLEPAGAPDRCWCEDNHWGEEGVEYVRVSALPAPDDGLEVVAWAGQGAIPISALEMDALIDSRDGDAYRYTDALVRLSDAQAALQSKDEQIERMMWDNEADRLRLARQQDDLRHFMARAGDLEQQVQKLTAENERLKEALGEEIVFGRLLPNKLTARSGLQTLPSIRKERGDAE